MKHARDPAAPVRTIAIIGGGSAGWMAAALLSRLLRPDYEITLIESDEIGTVGVGEATIPPIKQFNALLGIDEGDFIRATQGSFKLGIEFCDWGRIGDRYMHAFGPIGQMSGTLRCHQYWLRMRGLADVGALENYCINSVAAYHGRFMRGDKTRPNSPLSEITYAYHFDAALYARYLRSYSERRGVRRVEGRIVDTRLRGDDGFIESVVLDRGEEIAADFFIDCSGFRALLIGGALGVGFESWSRWLPCDRALAVPCSPGAHITPYTRSTAHAAGWQWRIPLQHRTGNGLVYASNALSDDQASMLLLARLDGEPAAVPRPIRFEPGRRKQAWAKNCVAIGLAGGFLEPLESTSLHMVQSALIRLIGLFPDRHFDPADIDEYNRQTQFEYERVRDFVILHYKAVERDDSEFWRHCSAMDVPDTLAEKLRVFASRGRVFRVADELFAEESWIQVLIGQHVTPGAPDPLVALKPIDETQQYLADIAAVIARCVETMPTHESALAQIAGQAAPMAAAGNTSQR